MIGRLRPVSPTFPETPVAMAMRAVIVDDESDARENLRIMLEDN
jgi:hypothetical protein